LTDELTGLYSITGWVTFVTAGTQTIFSYQISGSDHLRLSYSGSALVVTRAVSASYTLSQSVAVTDGTTLHYAIVNDGTNLLFYLNGVQAGTNAIGSALPADGTLFLGASNSSESGLAFDGFRVWEDTALTAAQTLAIYTAELAIKNDALNDTENYSLVGMPPFWSTPNNNGAVDNPGYGVLGGVNGTASALVEWQIQTQTISVDFDTIWLGIRASYTTFTVANTFIFTYNDSNAGQTGVTSLAGTTIADPDKLRGRVQFLMTFYSNGSTAEALARYRSAISYIIANPDTVSIASGSALLLRDLGDLNVDWPSNTTPFLALSATLTIAGTATLGRGYAVLMPYPNVKATPAGVDSNTGSVFVINPRSREAYIENTVAGNLTYYAERSGDVMAEPLRYNYVIFLAGTEGAVINTTNDWTITPVVTSRWLLPGGMIA
jgi:hypothetical protein